MFMKSYHVRETILLYRSGTAVQKVQCATEVQGVDSRDWSAGTGVQELQYMDWSAKTRVQRLDCRDSSAGT